MTSPALAARHALRVLFHAARVADYFRAHPGENEGDYCRACAGRSWIRRRYDGKRVCQRCHARRHRAWVRANADRAREYQREWKRRARQLRRIG